MKIKIEDYEVNIKARDTIISSRANVDDTRRLLNTISLALKIASGCEHDRCNFAIANEFDRLSTDIFNALEGQGYYE